MPATKPDDSATTAHGGAAFSRLRDKRVSDLIANKKRLVEVPYTASLADTINNLDEKSVVAPQGHRIGAGGSMIMESDKQTGAAEALYRDGDELTMLDVLAHIAGNGGEPKEGDAGDLARRDA